MKKCGYYRGYCTRDEKCDRTPVLWADGAAWAKVHHEAEECWFRAGSLGEWNRKIHILRRRRDWAIGNPYGRG